MKLVRRVFFIFTLFLVLGFAGLPAAAQSGRTFYIDYTSGSNSNPGTQAAPWKTHPYMQASAACTSTGSAPSYSHQAGDQFIFKGGVSWPAACFNMSVQKGGTNSVRDYYGVDKTWFSGASFTRPLFDMNYTVPSGNEVITGAVTTSGFGYITFDNIEIVHQAITIAPGTDQQQAFSFRNYSSPSNSPLGIVISNCYLHDWGVTSQLTSTNQPNYSAGSISGNVTVDGCEISDANGFHYVNGVRTTAHSGGGIQGVTNNVGVSEVRNSKIHDTMAGCFSVRSCHDNEFYNITQPTGDGGTTIHSQVIEDDDGWGPTHVYNNLIHDIYAGVVIDVCQGASIYNNIIYNNSNNFGIRLAGGGGSSGNCGSNITSNATSVYNNTIDCSGSASVCFGTDSHAGVSVDGNVNLQNNIWITNGANPVSINEPITGTLANDHNHTMSTSEAGTYGFTSARRYAPSSSDPQVTGKAIDILSVATGSLAALAFDAAGAPWFGASYMPRTATSDLGAFVFGAQSSSSKPNAPSNLTAIVQ